MFRLNESNKGLFRRLLDIYFRLEVRATSRAFAKKPYLDAYAQRTDALTKLDEKMAVGGLWEQMGQQQFDFLVSEGLLPRHTMLDIGCGTLRGGQYFIRYLERGHYSGFDISSGGIKKARELVEREGLGNKNPDLRVNEAKDLKFRDYQGMAFDFILAQSVFSHLMEEHIEEAFVHVSSIMNPNSKFFFTFHIGEYRERRSNTDFQYPLSFFEKLAKKYRFHLENRSSDYNHPRGQAMICLKMENS